MPDRAVLWHAAEAASATDGKPVGDWAATGVSIDSRSVQPGDLFIALEGPTHDGHDYVVDALARGAAAVMVHRVPDGLSADAPRLQVTDTYDGLWALGSFARHRTRAKIIAVTGSVGKTGTKEALKTALGRQGKVAATLGNLNNHWGAPLTLARLPEELDYAVVELGMNHAGEIGPLSRLVLPDVAIITTVQAVHLEFFDSVAAIADAKAEIFEGMSPAGIAVLPRDNPHFARLVAHARTTGVGRIWSFGSNPDAEASLVDCSLHATCSAVQAAILGNPIQYSLALPGEHWAVNSLAVLLAVRAVGADEVVAARALARLEATPGRGQRQRIELNGERGEARRFFTLIDESYNASPASVAAALGVLQRVDTDDDGRRILVLGDMLELGDEAERLHAELVGAVRDAEVDLVFACGSLSRALFDILPETRRGAWAPSSADLVDMVAGAVGHGDVVLVKGSLGSRMAKIVDRLQQFGHQAGDNGGRRAALGT